MVTDVTEALHYPRLDTILMVEETIRKSRNKNKTQVWRSLPRKTMYQTYLIVLDYLEKSGKIIVDKGQVLWIHDPKFVRRLAELSEHTYKT